MKLQETIQLFPIPLLVYDLGRSLTEFEMEYLQSHSAQRVRNLANTTSKNNRILDSVELKQLHADLTGILVDAFGHIYSPSTACEPYITQSWLNFTGKGQYHHNHTHPNSILSVVHYINTVDGDRIVFNRDTSHDMIMMEPKNRSVINAGSWIHRVKNNMVVVFPSRLSHLVPPVEYEGVRVSLSFNSFVRGELGAPHDLNHLVL